MATIVPTSNSDLESQVEQLKADLRNAEALRVRPEDAAANAIRQQLQRKEAELRQQQEFESAAAAEHQRSLDFQKLAQLERDIDQAKIETVTLRSMIVELPGRLSRAQWQLDQLLRSYSSLKKDLGL